MERSMVTQRAVVLLVLLSLLRFVSLLNKTLGGPGTMCFSLLC